MAAAAARCVACKHEHEFTPPPTPAAYDLPVCPECFSPMIVTTASAEARGRGVTDQPLRERAEALALLPGWQATLAQHYASGDYVSLGMAAQDFAEPLIAALLAEKERLEVRVAELEGKLGDS